MKFRYMVYGNFVATFQDTLEARHLRKRRSDHSYNIRGCLVPSRVVNTGVRLSSRILVTPHRYYVED